MPGDKEICDALCKLAHKMPIATIFSHTHFKQHIFHKT